MKKRKFLLLSIVLLLSTTILSGCWNYREIEKMTVVAGVAIDKGKNKKFQITAEIVDISGGKESNPVSRQITLEGDTIFDAVRNEISLAGKKLYWSHTKVIILSKAIAREGAAEVVDWFNRDNETRADVLMIVSKEKKAADIFKGVGLTNQILSYELADMAQNEQSLNKAPITELWSFFNQIESAGIAATLPAIQLNKNRNQLSPQIIGTAIFNKDKLIGFLSGIETKYMLFVLNKIRGGLIITNGSSNITRTPVTLEIFKSKTKIVPFIKDNKVAFNVQINATVIVDEFESNLNILDQKDIRLLEQHAEKDLKTRVENCIRHVQTAYGVDVFGFGEKLREDKPKIWKQVAKDWEKGSFKNMPVNVQASVHIKGSGMLSNTIEKRE